MKKKTYQILVVFAILSVFIAFSIAGYSIYQKNKAKSNETGQASDIETLDPEKSEVKEAEAEYSLNIEEDPIERLDDESVPSNSSIEIHFFDVGEGDSTLVACDGKVMLIDGGNPGSSRFLYSYLKQHEINHLDYVICSHAHEDHVGGLAGALNYATVGTVYAPVKEYDTRAFKSFVKYVEQHGNIITIPKAGDIFSLGNAKVEIIGPVDMSLAENNENNSSIVVHIIFGETSFLIMGDAEAEEEASILNAGYNVKSTVLRVGHHGSNTSTSDDFIKEVAPEYCVISVGSDNQYGHPHDEVINRISSYGAIIYRTDLNGEIHCVSDGRTVTFDFDRE